MKRIYIILMILFATAVSASANVFIEGFGAYTMAGDAKNESGPGMGLGYAVTENVNVFARGVFNSVTLNADKPNREKYSYRMFMGIVEYAYYFRDTPLAWINSAGLGASSTGVDFRLPGVESKQETGLTIAAWTGLVYVATQHISPFIEAGYHKSFYSADFSGSNISGFQLLAGVRITVFGRNRTIDSDY